MTDAALMREALRTLKFGAKFVWCRPDGLCPVGECRDCRYVQRASKLIAKLEDRLERGS